MLVLQPILIINFNLFTDADGGVGCLQVLCQTYGADEYLITPRKRRT